MSGEESRAITARTTQLCLAPGHPFPGPSGVIPKDFPALALALGSWLQ